MVPLSVLHLSLPDGGLRLERCAPDRGPLGPVEAAAAAAPEAAVFALGAGAGGQRTRATGGAWLCAAAPSPTWGALAADALGPAGQGWLGLGLSSLVIHGRAASPCALRLRGAAGRLRLEQIVLDPAQCFQAEEPESDEAPVGGDALLGRLAQAGWGAQPADVVLVGPAALCVHYGGLRLRRLGQGPAQAQGRPPLLLSRGGLGSQLATEHNLLALVFEGEDTDSPGAAEPEAERRSRSLLPPNNLVSLREWLTCFSHRSVYFPRGAREETYEFLVARSLLTQMEVSGRSTELRAECGRACSGPCQAPGREYRRSDEALLSLGPHLGVFDLDAVDALLRFVDVLGVDPLEAAGSVAWLMECLASAWLEPAQLGVYQRPRWDPDDFDPQPDSEHNAALAGTLLEGLYLNCSRALRGLGDLRAAHRDFGPRAADAAVFLAAGRSGWSCPPPVWVPDLLLPLALPLRALLHDRYEYLPPLELGKRAGSWLCAELALLDLGICPEQRSWALGAGLNELLREQGVAGSWRERYRPLAARLQRQLAPRPFPTLRSQDMLARYLVQAQVSLAPDAELDRWVARVFRDGEAACRDYALAWQRGLEDELEG